jgi:hypothetical protein
MHRFKGVAKRCMLLVLSLLLVAGIVPLPTFAASCPCNIWSGTTAPATANTADSNAVELGVKFQATVTGNVTGVRFYKGSQNTGTHTGSLWNANGTLLAKATFVNETASGWQQVNFAAPVAVTANTTYVASYYAPVGKYSSNSNYFNSTITNGPLKALSATTPGGNGVYKYGTGGGFPNSTYNKTNYWVDVVFSEGSVADTTPPAVASVSPANATNNVAPSSNVSVVFSEGLTANTVTTASFELRDSANAVVPAAVSYNATSQTATLDPSQNLDAGATYTATVKGGTTDPRVKDTTGNALSANYSWQFTVAADLPSSPIEQGPGGPVLVINSSSRPFSKYYAEILRAEGVNSFATADISTVTATTLAQYDIVLLGETPLSSAQVTLLGNWVNSGGNLVAMRPDKQLAGLLGLTDQNATINEGYILANQASNAGAGIVDQTIQYHGTADKYGLNADTTKVASLYNNATNDSGSPAVTLRNVGNGKAAAFTYDLARSVVYSHQGNPDWAGQERDGSSPIRPNDLFFGAGQTDYINLDKVAIPQADEQQRLLVNLLQDMNQNKKPLPKFWYFPKGSKAVVVMVGDDHVGGTLTSTKESFEYLKANSPTNCNVANWECARSSSLIYENSPLTNQEAASYNAQGFEVGSHVSTECNNWTPQSLAQAFTNDLNAFRGKYTSLPNQATTRTHCIAWSDWATSPKVELANGMRMDLNYYYWPGTWVQQRPGYFTGSGLPMRYADTDGSMIDVIQVPSHLVNENGGPYPAGIDTQLDRALGPEGYYGAIGTHYDYSDQFDKQLVQSAKARGVPLVSGKQMLDWTDARNASSFGSGTWSGNTFTFAATVDARAGTMMRGMIPVQTNKGSLTGITSGGNQVVYTTETIKGVTYALFPTVTGTYIASYASDTTAPTVTGTLPAANATNVSQTTQVSATFSEAIDLSSLTTNTFELRNSANAVQASTLTYDAATKTATLAPNSPLVGGAIFTATVKGGASGIKDIVGNPLAADVTWSFTTATGPVCPCSLWPANPTPATVTVGDSSAVELGVRFTSDVDGSISGVRFYKGPSNTGTHTVTLWGPNGAALATATAINETPSGWQTATFNSPVAIAANTTYTASYMAPNGYYSATGNYFGTGYINTPLRTGTSAGVYKYGGGYPTDSYNNTNYWVDVVFAP